MNAPDHTPVIGISGSNADSASVRAMFTQIAASGATPIFLGNHGKRDAAADIQKIDALIVMGNNADINPAKYNAEKSTHTNVEDATPEGRARADYEEAMLRSALDQGMPVLGVCGGMQRLNVLCGGTLHQHVPDLVGHNEHAQQDLNIAPFVPVQPVIIDQHSKLAAIGKDVTSVYTSAHAAPVDLIQENSMHHQAVDRVGSGLKAVAYSADKIKKPGGEELLVEAVEADPNGKFGRQFVLGVQWHPEFSASPLGVRIAQSVVGAAQEFAVAHDRAHPISQAVDENIASALQQVKDIQPQAVALGSMTDRILRQRGAPISRA